MLPCSRWSARSLQNTSGATGKQPFNALEDLMLIEWPQLWSRLREVDCKRRHSVLLPRRGVHHRVELGDGTCVWVRALGLGSSVRRRPGAMLGWGLFASFGVVGRVNCNVCGAMGKRNLPLSNNRWNGIWLGTEIEWKLLTSIWAFGLGEGF